MEAQAPSKLANHSNENGKQACVHSLSSIALQEVKL